MADTLDPKHLDKRTAERYLRSGQLDEGTYERHIKELPDVAEKSVPVETAMDGEEFFDDEDDEAGDEGDEGEEAAADDTEDGDDEDEDEDEAAGDAAEDTENP